MLKRNISSCLRSERFPRARFRLQQRTRQGPTDVHVRRPSGQQQPDESSQPVLRPMVSNRIDQLRVTR